MRWLITACLLATTAAFAAGEGDDKTIASQGKASLTFSDVDARMSRIPEKDRAGTIGNPERLESIVSGMLLIRQLAIEARESGLDKDPEIAREIALAAEGVLARHRLEQVGLAAKVDASMLAKEVYQSNPADFTVPELRQARHILIRFQERPREEAKKLAEQVLAEARKPGADFAKLAGERSEDETTKVNGGLLPEFGPDVMEQNFYDATFALAKPGDLSDVVETPYGYHVIQLVRITPSRLRPYDEVREALQKKLEQEQRERVVQEHADTLRNLPVEADPPSIAALRTRYDHLVAPAGAVQPAAKDVLDTIDAEATPESTTPRSP